MDFDKLKDAASNLTDSGKDGSSGLVDKVKGALSDEESTDAALDRAAGAANKATGEKYADHVEKARKFGDDRLGDERK